MQIDEERSRTSEQSYIMYNKVGDSHEKSKEFDKTYKEVTKEVQSLNREKESVEKQRTEAIKKHAQLELDYKDLQEKMSGNIKAKVNLCRISMLSLPFDLDIIILKTCKHSCILTRCINICFYLVWFVANILDPIQVTKVVKRSLLATI